jgi:uncharacterized membrane protein YvbJ
MYCRRCGTQNPENATQCVKCGEALGLIAPDQNQPQVQRQVIPSHLALAIVSTILFFWPTGVVAIVNAAKVGTAVSAGNTQEAMIASAKAKKWSIVSIIVSVCLWVLYFAFWFLLVAAAYK